MRPTKWYTVCLTQIDFNYFTRERVLKFFNNLINVNKQYVNLNNIL